MDGIEIAEAVTLNVHPLAALLELTVDGVGLFELLSIKTSTDLLPHLQLKVGGSDGVRLTRVADAESALLHLLQQNSEVEDYLASCFERVVEVQTGIRQSSDPAIACEIAAITNGTHSRFKLLARPDARGASGPRYPRRSLATCVYELFQDVCAIQSIASATLFGTEDIGLVHIACNELIFRRAANSHGGTDLRKEAVKLSMHPDYVCWDEDNNMYQLPGWPDWADYATWFDNLPLESQLHVMHFSSPDEHFRLVTSGSRYAESEIAFLVARNPAPRCTLHESYAWHWHPCNVFIGVHRDASADLKVSFRGLSAKHELFSASASRSNRRGC